jgi:hypothetical protein
MMFCIGTASKQESFGAIIATMGYHWPTGHWVCQFQAIPNCGMRLRTAVKYFVAGRTDTDRAQ